MAASNGFTPEQSSDLYITDGTIIDWLWGAHRIFAYTFELYPKTSSPGFYPPDEVIPAQTSRNRDAFLQLIEAADCPYRSIGKQAQYCGTPPEPTPTPSPTASPTPTPTASPSPSPTPGPATIFSDDFETARGWTANASGTDTATTGRFERADPAATSDNGAKQLGTTVSGANDLVTGASAGASAGANDIDGGVTSIRSPAITLTGKSNYSLSFSSYLAHGSNATSAGLPARPRRRRHDEHRLLRRGRGEQPQRRLDLPVRLAQRVRRPDRPHPRGSGRRRQRQPGRGGRRQRRGHRHVVPTA